MKQNIALVDAAVISQSSNHWIGTPPRINVENDDGMDKSGSTPSNVKISNAVMDWVGSLSLEVDEETSLNSYQKDKFYVPMYKRPHQDIVNEKYQFYKGLFESYLQSNPHVIKKERVTSHTIEVVEDDNHEKNKKRKIIPITIFWPSEYNQTILNMERVCVHCHGGGWLFGDSKYQVGERMLHMSSVLQIPVLSIEYRMVPNHPYPDPVDDIQHVLEWLLLTKTSASYSFTTATTTRKTLNHLENVRENRKIVASGESAGAHLLLLAMIRLMKSQPQLFVKEKILALNLVYGVYDLSGTESLKNDNDKSAPLSGNELQWMMDMHVPPSWKPHPKHSDISPLYFFDLSIKNNNIQQQVAINLSLPPTLFTVGTADPLLEDTVRMACHYNSFQNDIYYFTKNNSTNNSKESTEVELAIYAGGQHGIGHFGTQQNISSGNNAREYTEQFLFQHLNKIN